MPLTFRKESSESVTIFGERAVTPNLVVHRRWQRFMILCLSSADGGMTVGLWKLSSLDGRRPPWYRPLGSIPCGPPSGYTFEALSRFLAFLSQISLKRRNSWLQETNQSGARSYKHTCHHWDRRELGGPVHWCVSQRKFTTDGLTHRQAEGSERTLWQFGRERLGSPLLVKLRL